MDSSLSSAVDALLRSVGSADDWQAIQEAAQRLADALGRQQELRTSLGERGLPKHVVQLLQKDAVTVEAETQLFRVLGNLVVGEQDAIRRVLLEEGAPSIIAQAIAQTSNANQLKAAVGVALNLSMDYSPSRSAYVETGLYNALLALLEPNALQGTIKEAGLAKAVFSWSLQIVEDILTAKTALSPTLLRQTIATLCSIILASVSGSGIPDVDSENLSTSAELLEALTLDEDAAPGAFLTTDGNPFKWLEGLCDFVETASPPSNWQESDATPFSNSKAAVCKVITAASADRTVMDAVFAKPNNRLLKTLLQWVEGDAQDDRVDLLVTGSIALANLARKDENCVALVHQHGLVEPLARILQERTSSTRDRSKGKPGENTHILHGLLGLLKHLAIPPANKGILGDAGIIQPTLGMLKPSFDIVSPIQHSAVGLLKHLGAGNLSNTLHIVSAPGLQAILDIIARTDDFRLRSEATRILANVTRTAWTAAGDGGITQGRDEVKNRLSASSAVAAALSEMVRNSEKYPLLVNEGISALALLASANASSVLEALVVEHESILSPASAVPSSLNGKTYEPSPVSTAPMPFSDKASHVVARTASKSSIPPRSGSGASSSSKPTSAAIALGNCVSSPTLPVEIRINACTLCEVVASGGKKSPLLTQLALTCESKLELVKNSSTDSEGLKQASERAWQLLSARGAV